MSPEAKAPAPEGQPGPHPFFQPAVPQPVAQALQVLMAYVPPGYELEFRVEVHPTIAIPGREGQLAEEFLRISRPAGGRTVPGVRKITTAGYGEGATQKPPPDGGGA